LLFRKGIQEWIDEEDNWSRLVYGGELFSLQEVASKTDLGTDDLKDGLRYGFEVRKERRFQHLCYIPDNYVGCDSEETARTCLIKWLKKNDYFCYGSRFREISFDTNGSEAICRLAKSGDVIGWENLRDHFTKNGIDVVAYSESAKILWIIELKGWTSTSNDFNETIHQILRRIKGISRKCQLLSNLKFACAFPYFWKVTEWTKKFNALIDISEDPNELPAQFGSSSTVKKEEGVRFLEEFTREPLSVANLMKMNQLLFMIIKSPSDVRNILTSKSIDL
jgi:hypothetical protein